MVLWLGASCAFCFGFLALGKSICVSTRSIWIKSQRHGLEQVIEAMRTIEDLLQAGLLPQDSDWAALAKLSEPWRTAIQTSVQELRRQGSPLLPTLKRFGHLARRQLETLLRAHALAAQGLAQAGAALLLVPFCSALFFSLLESPRNSPWIWGTATAGSLLGAGAGAFWILRLAESARWAGLRLNQRSWIVSAFLGLERVLSEIRAGKTADVAWALAWTGVHQMSPELAASWQAALWTHSTPKTSAAGVSGTLVEVATSVRKSIQVSLMEGRPCLERIELVSQQLGADLESATLRELSLLGNRCLKPLFLCVAPSVLGLITVALALEVMGAGQSGF